MNPLFVHAFQISVPFSMLDRELVVTILSYFGTIGKQVPLQVQLVLVVGCLDIQVMDGISGCLQVLLEVLKPWC